MNFRIRERGKGKIRLPKEVHRNTKLTKNSNNIIRNTGSNVTSIKESR